LYLPQLQIYFCETPFIEGIFALVLSRISLLDVASASTALFLKFTYSGNLMIASGESSLSK